MSGIVVFPATTRQNQIAWSGIPGSTDTTLFMNSDLNNFAYLGYTPNLIPNVNSIPVAPNGNVVLPASRTIYAIWSTSTGVAPLVIIPGGAAYFLGLTQGLGNLAIPSVQSPNFVSGISGWQIAKDGSAQFNNLTIRGTFFGLDFIINSNGAFFYNGTPAHGNLKISIVSNGGGTDSFGNVYLDNITAYNVAVAGGGYAQVAANPTTGIPFLVLNPPGGAHVSAPPQVNSGLVNAGAVNEQTQINVSSGFEVAAGGAGAAVIQVVSRSNDLTQASIINLISDTVLATMPDNTYKVGHATVANTGTVLINTTAGNLVHGFNVIPRTYRIQGKLWINAAAAGVAQPFSFQLQGTSTATMRIFTNFSVPEVPAGNINYGKITAYSADPDQIAGNLANNGALVAEYSGVVFVTVAGTLGVYGRQVTSAADETFNVLAGSYTDLIPV